MNNLVFRFLKYWWAPIFTTPLVAFFMIFFIPFLALSLLNSRSALLGLMGFGVLSLPIVVSTLHQLKPKILVSGAFGIVVVAWFSRPSVFDGNPKMALASYLVPWILAATLFVCVAAVMLMRRRLD